MTATRFEPTSGNHRAGGVREALDDGSHALRRLLRLRRRRVELAFERAMLVSAGSVAAIVAIGASLAAAATAIVWGLASWLTSALAWPAWATPLAAGSALAMALALGTRGFAKRWRPARPSWEHEDVDELDDTDLLAEERAARATVTASAERAARELASPLGLLVAAVGGFAAYRALRRHPVATSALLGAYRLGRRWWGGR